ncbi:hypothetical protein ABT373_15980 [Streptomyces sp. NPDC000070]|uniref:hypothetical protein n=1 Tax=Streptomyces sp. NPDC000070 TaxID=3154240 RepID=UPI00332B3D3A
MPPASGTYGPPAGGALPPASGAYGPAGADAYNSPAGAPGSRGTGGYGAGPAGGQSPQQAEAYNSPAGGPGSQGAGGYGAGPAGGQSPQQADVYDSPAGGPGSQGAGGYGAGPAGGQSPQQAEAYNSPAGGPGSQGTGGYGAGSAGWQSPQQAYAYGTGPAGGQPPQQADAYGTGSAGGQLPQQSDAYGSPAGGDRPPASGAYGSAAAGGPQPSGSAGHGPGPGRAPLPPAADEGATQYLPPVAGDGAAATQYLPPVAATPADEGATQYIPPVGPGALPPEMPAEQDSEATRFLGTGPLPPASNPDAEATQYIAPVPGADQQPPAGFENLFRSEHGAESPAAATQQLPRFEQPSPRPQSHPQPSYTPPGGGHSGRGGRSGSRVPVIAAVGIGIVVLGVGAGALLAGGGGGDDGGGDNKTVAASEPATEGSASPSADPARAQAVELDKLLADSGDSRSTVINAVSDVKGCDNLAQAAKDLRDAARQRNQLVTRLSGVTVDKLPDHAALTTALTKAWRASASADNHYAAWADQTAGKKGCKKGQARVTGQTLAGNRASGVASAEKAKAAQLWNGIAKTYGLTERQPTQL